MLISITFDLPDELLKTKAASAMNELFYAQTGNGSRGEGYRLLQLAALEAIRELDLVAICREQASILAPGIVEKVVEEKVRKMAKEVVVSEVKRGTLL